MAGGGRGDGKSSVDHGHHLIGQSGDTGGVSSSARISLARAVRRARSSSFSIALWSRLADRVASAARLTISSAVSTRACAAAADWCSRSRKCACAPIDAAETRVSGAGATASASARIRLCRLVSLACFSCARISSARTSPSCSVRTRWMRASFLASGTEDAGQFGDRLVQADRLVRRLLDIFHHHRVRGDGVVDRRIGAGAVGAHQHQVAVFLVRRQVPAQHARGMNVIGVRDIGHHAADRRTDVDRRIDAALGEMPVEHDMPVEDRPRRIDDRIVAVVAIGQHGIDGGDRPAAAHVGAGALDQIGQHRDGGRRITARAGGFAQRQPDLAARMRDAGQRIHDEQHLLALIAKGFGDGGGAQCATDAQHGAVVGGHRDDDGALARLARDLGFEEVGDFSGSLADQPDDDDVGLGRLHHHAEQHRLADARSRHDADALALTDRQQPVDRPHADVHRLEHAAAVERRLQLAGERPFACTADRA
ncbi:hypothetical protein WR25_05434 [Diploscapter pachys]|uniref:Uncharacterized protein n=1 Tax=Diploscapter pachys TaxID=2018661 RepID=A0A2A2KJW7_9BILA|nr:hypothetical protein WR25_05434 [Diploscapter pachys]